MPPENGWFRLELQGNPTTTKPMQPKQDTVTDNNTLYSQTVGTRGPVLLQDSVLHESLETLIHSKLLERPLHVKGFGAFGTFHTMHSMEKYTKLSFLQTPGQEVPIMTRFSLAAGNAGTPDTSRNIRGFSTKFYTSGGIFDLICNHIPVFLIRDGMRFPEALMSLSPSPVNNLANWSPADQITSGKGRHVEGPLVRSGIPDPDNFTQAGQYYNSLSPEGQNHLVNNLATDLTLVSTETQNIVLKYFNCASNNLAQRVENQIIERTDSPSSPQCSGKEGLFLHNFLH